jgi:hypothetical protein
MLAKELQPTALGESDHDLGSITFGWNILVKPLRRQAEVMNLVSDVLELKR